MKDEQGINQFTYRGFHISLFAPFGHQVNGYVRRDGIGSEFRVSKRYDGRGTVRHVRRVIRSAMRDIDQSIREKE